MADVVFSVGARDETGRGLRRTQRNFQATGRAAETALQGISRQASLTQRVVGSIGAALGPLAGAGLAASAIGAVGFAVTDLVDELEQAVDVARRYDVEASRAIAQTDAFRAAGRGLEDLEDAYGTLLERVGELALGEQTAIDLWTALGLTIEDLAGKSGDEVVLLTVQALANIQDSALRAQAAIALGGDTVGKSLLDAAALGQDGIERLAADSQQFTDDQLQAIDELGVAWRGLTTDIRGYGRQALAYLAELAVYGFAATLPEEHQIRLPGPVRGRFGNIGVSDPFAQDLGTTGGSTTGRAYQEALAQGARDAEVALQAAVEAQDLKNEADREAEAAARSAAAAAQAYADAMFGVDGALSDQGASLLANEILLGRQTEDLNAQERALLMANIQMQAQAQLLESNANLEMLRAEAIRQGNIALVDSLTAQLEYRQSLAGSADLQRDLVATLTDRVFGAEQRRIQQAADRAQREYEREQERLDRLRLADARAASDARNRTITQVTVNYFGDIRLESIGDERVRQFQESVNRGMLHTEDTILANDRLLGFGANSLRGLS